jgi:excisionase family DNA binding protein
MRPASWPSAGGPPLSLHGACPGCEPARCDGRQRGSGIWRRWHRCLALLSMDEAAYLQVSRRWVAEAVRQRRIRSTRIGKHVRFKTEHLEELVRAGEQPVTGPPGALGAGGHPGSPAPKVRSSTAQAPLHHVRPAAVAAFPGLDPGHPEHLRGVGHLGAPMRVVRGRKMKKRPRGAGAFPVSEGGLEPPRPNTGTSTSS